MAVIQGWGDGGLPPYGWYKIDRYGGAVYAAERSTPTFTQCIFEDNQTDTVGPETTYTGGDATTVEDPYFAYGGTIACEDDAAVTLNDCVIENSLSHHGGGLYAEHATLQVTDCNFVGNTASFGGGVYYVDTEATIDKTIFHENTADLDASQGGALATFDAKSVFTDVVVVNNTSGRSGGGFFVSGSDEMTIRNGLFAGNSAGRDGGGLSVNWYSDVTIDNCTFADNDVSGSSGMSLGGGIFVGYQSFADIIDSIVWGNSAMTGQQIAVTTGFEYSPAPSVVTIEYSNVKDFLSSNSLYSDEYCDADPNGATVFSADPVFVKLPGSGASDIAADYYLDQEESSCISVGSTNSLDKLLFEDEGITFFDYTTSTDGVQDKSIIDLGYHYESALSRIFCSYVDMAEPADGQVNLADWAEFASWWLEGSCSEGDAAFGGNNWCGGADLNFNSRIDADDMMLFVSCWLKADTDAPTPDPAVWLVEPYVTLTDSVYMEAVQAKDQWGGVEYRFEASTAEGSSHDSGWRQSFDPDRAGYIYDLGDETVRAWIFEDTGLADGVEYTYVVRVRDIAGNETDPSTEVSVTLGIDSNPPSPDPAQWDVEPYQSGLVSIRMQAVQATDDNGVEYRFVCEEDGGLSSEWQQNADPGETATYVDTPWVYEVDGLTLGETYTFYTVTRDRADIPNITDPSVSVAVTIAEVDSEAPTPNPAEHASAPDSQESGGNWYCIVLATEATDDSGVEYKFVCNESDYSSGGDNGPEWRNADNVGLGTSYEYYPGFSGMVQTPQTYVVLTGSHKPELIWWIYYRDRSVLHNSSGSSTGWSELNGEEAAPLPDLPPYSP